jgi:hypothetical protein
MATNSEEKVTNEATEAQTTVVPVTGRTSITAYQFCLLCENTRALPKGMYYCNTPWVCDECKEAIAFVKEFKAGIKEVPADKTKEIEASIALL